MPWIPRYTESEARAAAAGAKTWKQVVAAVDVTYSGKNIARFRKWAALWQIPVGHLSDNRGGWRVPDPYDEEAARVAIAASRSWAETLRRLGYCQSGGNHAVLKGRARAWGIPTDHFDPYAAARGAPSRRKPLEEILVRGSTYSRSSLKERLYESGLKERQCELCGQAEKWRGRRMGLILDHINGIRDDNRLENLRIICPNCAATLDTHCGKKAHPRLKDRRCRGCHRIYRPTRAASRYCSPACFHERRRAKGLQVRGVPRPHLRKVGRPPYAVLLLEIEEMGYSAVGRKYGVSDNAIRKWIRQYQREAERRNGDSRGGLPEAA